MVCFSEKVSLETFKTTLEIIKKKKKWKESAAFGEIQLQLGQ